MKSRSFGGWAFCGICCLLAASCGDDGPAGVLPDAGGLRDGGDTVMDGAPLPDGATAPDSGNPDGAVAMDSAIPVDSSIPRRDGTVPPPDGPVTRPDANLPDPCDGIPPSTPCTPEICGESSRCVANGCGSTHCVPAGHPCADIRDCPAGSVCATTPRGRACLRSVGCADSRDCPLGFSCDGGSCVDRRIACGPLTPCPFGFVCGGTELGGAPFCVRIHTPCVNAAACPVPRPLCADLDGDGTSECTVGGSCLNNASCPALSQCSYDPTRRGAACVSFGLCQSAADCGTGFECIDLWGDGLKECAKVGGSCTRTAECTAFALCGTREGGAPPSCTGTPF